jgi:endonuclease G
MTNQHTFYCSNVTPQLHDFNGGIWNNLENAVRGWSPSGSSQSKDTLYVVTGCVVDASCSTVKDNSNQSVAVPKAYYKALLRLKNGSYMGAGFYLPHSQDIVNGNYKDYVMSLKDLEEKTGMTFFVNLPSDIAASVKSKHPKNSEDNKFWNL